MQEFSITTKVSVDCGEGGSDRSDGVIGTGFSEDSEVIASLLFLDKLSSTRGTMMMAMANFEVVDGG